MQSEMHNSLIITTEVVIFPPHVPSYGAVFVYDDRSSYHMFFIVYLHSITVNVTSYHSHD